MRAYVMLKRVMSILMLSGLLCLTGCHSLLVRQYSTSTPHIGRFWESEAAGTLRAENYQDVVNDLLLVIGQHRDNATLRLYDFGDSLLVTDTLNQAAQEVQQDTPLGSYAVSYLTFTSSAQRGYYEANISIGYRRELAQLQSIVHATSTEALYSLLQSALDSHLTELAVLIGYWDSDGYARVEEAVDRVREERGLTDAPPWQIDYYPTTEDVGLIEFHMEDRTEEGQAENRQAEEGSSGSEMGST